MSHSEWVGTPAIKGSSESMRMALLTISQVGLQITWGLEMTYCTPYLLELGLSKSRTSLVWIAGPLSGLIMQPIVGVLADNSRSKWGRRRPFMMGGAVLVAFCLFILGWTAEVVACLIPDKETARPYVVFLAVVTIYALDFAINVTQSSGRSLIVDTLPIAKQQKGSAWAARMVACGSLVGYYVGTLDLVAVLGSGLGDTQFKQVTSLAAIAFFSTTAVTCWATEERVLVSQSEGDLKASAVRTLAKIVKMTLHLPDRIFAICAVQFWAWIGWFPFMFYSTTWVGEVYFRYHPEAQASADALGDVGRIGSQSLVIFSIVTLLATVSLPWLIESPDSATQTNSFTSRPPAAIKQYLEPILGWMQPRKPTLLTAWQLSHLMFASTMILAPFVTSLHGAKILVSICGIPWALACWAPFTFLGVEVNRLTAPNTTMNGTHRRTSSLENGHLASAGSSPKLLHLNHLDKDIIDEEKEPLSLEYEEKEHDSDIEPNHNTSTGETAGIYLGILNVFTTLPQFVGTFISWIVFSILEPGVSPELHKEATHEDVVKAANRPNGIAVCLFIGALSTIGAAYATGRMRRKGMR